MNKKTLLWILIAVLACGGIAFGSYSLGRDSIAQKVQQEKELNILLNRSDLEHIDLVDGPIYVFGHQSPDSDTVCSSIVYANLLTQLGYDARPAVLGKINNETAYILKYAGVPVPELLEDASGKNVILMDHSELIQSAEGLKDANIISIIDHHNDGTVTTSKQIIYDARPIGGTATIVWIRSRNYGLELDKPMAALLFGALLSDTSYLKSKTTTSADQAAFRELSRIAEIKDTQAFFQEMEKAALSYEGMTDEEILTSDIKNYESAGRLFTIGCMNAYDRAGAEALVERVKDLLPDLSVSRGVEMSFAQVSVFRDDISLTFVVPSDETAAETLKAAFPDNDTFDGTMMVFDPGISRKQTLVPALSDVLAAHPNE